MSIIVSTEFEGQHRDWQMPDEREELHEFLNELDEDVFPPFNSPHGEFTDQVDKLVEAIAAGQRERGSLVLPVDEDRDVTIDIARRDD